MDHSDAFLDAFRYGPLPRASAWDTDPTPGPTDPPAIPPMPRWDGTFARPTLTLPKPSDAVDEDALDAVMDWLADEREGQAVFSIAEFYAPYDTGVNEARIAMAAESFANAVEECERAGRTLPEGWPIANLATALHASRIADARRDYVDAVEAARNAARNAHAQAWRDRPDVRSAMDARAAWDAHRAMSAQRIQANGERVTGFPSREAFARHFLATATPTERAAAFLFHRWIPGAAGVPVTPTK